MLNGYIKHIVSASAHPAEITFTARGGSDTYTLDQILELKEEAWFRRGSRCRTSATATSPRRQLRSSRRSGRRLASLTRSQRQRCRSITPIKCARSSKRWACKQRPSTAGSLTTGRPRCSPSSATTRLTSSCRWPCSARIRPSPLSVAAIFRPYRSLSPYIQFVGRVMRTVDLNDPNSPNNQGFVVSHVGLNNEEQWDEFRDLDTHDQQIVRGGPVEKEPNRPDETATAIPNRRRSASTTLWPRTSASATFSIARS